jgi:hypothetical protein
MATDAQIQQLSNELISLTRIMRDMVDASSRTVAAQRANIVSSMEQQEEMEKFEKALRGNRKLTSQQEKLVKDAIALKKQEQKAEREYLKARNESIRADRNARTPEAEKQRLATLALGAQRRLQAAQAATQQATQGLGVSMSGLTKTTNLTSAALAWFGNTLAAQGKQLLAQNKANSGVVEGTGSLAMALFEQQNVALKYRMTGAEFAEISTKNRQMINAMGGSTLAFAQMTPTITRMQILTGDATEALRLTSEVATDFAKKGIRPTMDVMERYTDDLVQLQRRTGMSTRQAAEYFDAIASDVDSIDILRSARKEEREAILRSQRALVEQSIAAGMSAEQAQRAAKMLNSMVAAKPLDRLKQAARVRALSGAMGIAGGDDAANAIIAGKRATAEQREKANDFFQRAAGAMDQAAGQGLGGEIFATQLADKLGLEQYFGKDSPFSTTLGDTMKPAFADLKQAYVDASKDWGAQQVNWLADIWKQLTLILGGDHWGGVIASGITWIVSAIAGGKLVSALAGKVGNIMQGGKGILGRTGGAVATTVGEGAAGVGAAGAAGAGAAGAAGASKLARAGQLAKGVAITAAIAGVAGAGVDWAAGKAGVGGKQIDEDQDEANWQRASAWEKTQSAIPRLIEKLGSFAFLDNMANEARAERIAKETAYLDAKAADGAAQPKTGPASPEAQGEAIKKTAESSNEIKVATMATADRLAEQIKKMDSSNDFLKKIADLSERQIELSERQLVALTMTERERTDGTNRTNLRRDSKFGAQYNYV